MSLAQGHRRTWLRWDSHLELDKEMPKADRAPGLKSEGVSGIIRRPGKVFGGGLFQGLGDVGVVRQLEKIRVREE